MFGVLDYYTGSSITQEEGHCPRAVNFFLQKIAFGLQAKPFISEAHVFNDAGLSFDVWPPKTGSFSVTPFTHETGATDGSHSNTGGVVIETSGNKLPLVIDSCPADITTVNGTNSAGSHNDSVGNGYGGGGSTEISRGYLLAVKLWQEAVATFAAASRNAAHTQK